MISIESPNLQYDSSTYICLLLQLKVQSTIAESTKYGGRKRKVRWSKAQSTAVESAKYDSRKCKVR